MAQKKKTALFGDIIALPWWVSSLAGLGMFLYASQLPKIFMFLCLLVSCALFFFSFIMLLLTLGERMFAKKPPSEEGKGEK